MRQYEGLFLFESTFAAEFTNVETELQRIMGRAGAEVLLVAKWEDRKLAYEIKRQKRGCYVVVYFTAPPGKITDMERDCRLSEAILRVLFLNADGVSREHIDRTIERLQASASGKSSERSDERPGDGRGGDYRGRRRQFDSDEDDDDVSFDRPRRSTAVATENVDSSDVDDNS